MAKTNVESKEMTTTKFKKIFTLGKSKGDLIGLLSEVKSIGLAEKCLWFLSKNKRHIFHFHPELY